jgi:hypothetical protein
LAHLTCPVCQPCIPLTPMKTVAEQLGQTPHLSPLLRKLRAVGLVAPDDLRRLAVARGCSHYRQTDDQSRSFDPRVEQISNLELAIAMVTAAQSFDPVLVRCASQLLSGNNISVEAIVRLAKQERAVRVIRHIAKAGAELDTEDEDKWRRLLTLLPDTPEIPEGRLPHWTRFVSQTGITRVGKRLDRTPRSIWLRPTPLAQR